jgi:hypothetical protein
MAHPGPRYVNIAGLWVCRYCIGRGCLSCPDPPRINWHYPAEQPTEPMLTMTYEEMSDHASEAFRVFKAAVGRDALAKAFSPTGRGFEEVRENIARERQRIRLEKDCNDGDVTCCWRARLTTERCRCLDCAKCQME